VLRALVIASIALAGCSDRCPRGPTTTCWCPGDVVGESTCGEDGRYGTCVCPGAPAPEVAPIAPPPPPTQRPVLMPIPNGVEPPTSAAPTAARDQSIAAWIAGPVRGHDNRMAAMRRVTIRGTEGAYTITIDNQFGFHCDLDFDAAGQPSALRGCRSGEPDWHASPDVIAVTCAPAGFDLECQAPYVLGGQSGYSSREIILFRVRS
jgi:hypothetical protein